MKAFLSAVSWFVTGFLSNFAVGVVAGKGSSIAIEVPDQSAELRKLADEVRELRVALRGSDTEEVPRG